MKMRTKIKDLVKQFPPSSSDVVIGLGMALVGVYVIGYASGNEDGVTKGITQGRGEVLNTIVFASCEDGLIMNNPDLGRYIFTAKKLDK